MKHSKLLHQYKNGNYIVRLFDDGTKLRFTLDDEFVSDFPESIDIKITNHCDLNCPMCHEKSSLNGSHGLLNIPFLKALPKGIELAIGGGNPLSHPELKMFLNEMRLSGIVSNLTVNQKHFVKEKVLIEKLINEHLIYGFGISVINDEAIDDIIDFSKKYPNTVVHVIAGIISLELLKKLYDQNIKLLVLGYKCFGRGKNYYSENVKHKIEYLKENILDISNHFNLVSFDNQALLDLEIRKQIGEEKYNKYYMGDDGLFTMYIDLVEKKFAVSSTSSVRYNLLNNIEDMFKVVKEEVNGKDFLLDCKR